MVVPGQRLCYRLRVRRYIFFQHFAVFRFFINTFQNPPERTCLCKPVQVPSYGFRISNISKIRIDKNGSFCRCANPLLNLPGISVCHFAHLLLSRILYIIRDKFSIGSESFVYSIPMQIRIYTAISKKKRTAAGKGQSIYYFLSQILCIIRDIFKQRADKSSRASGIRWVRPPWEPGGRYIPRTRSVCPQSPCHTPYKSGIPGWK